MLLSLRELRGRPAESYVLLAVSLLASMLFLSLHIIVNGANAGNVLLVFSGMMLLFLGGILFRVKADRLSRERWLEQSVFSLLGPVIASVPIMIFLGGG